jgi:hypothetical protein
MTGQKLIIVDNCDTCHYGKVYNNLLGVYCSQLQKQLMPTEKWTPQKGTHPDCKLESAKGFL